jgi:hypothetical protein
MALAFVQFKATVNVIDSSNSTTIKTYNLRAVNFADAQTETDTIIAALLAISDSKVGRYQISYVSEDNAFTLPANGVQNAEKAELVVRLAGFATKTERLRVPAPKAEIFTSLTNAGANVVDTANAGVLAYVALFESTGEAYISDGEDAISPASNALISGRRITVKSNNP